MTTVTNPLDLCKELKGKYGGNVRYESYLNYDSACLETNRVHIIYFKETCYKFMVPACSDEDSENNQSNWNYLTGLLAPAVEEIDWDRRFLKMAAGEINTWSKDPSTKVSATVFKGKYPIASSYNGFPPGIEDTHDRLHNRELKYKLVQHAEANAIATCARLGIATEGTTMAVTHFPCSTCAGLMISAGIAKIVVQTPSEDFLSRWKETVTLSREMFKEAGVQVVEIDITKDNE